VNELLALRLALIAIVFVFALAVAVSLRGGLAAPRSAAAAPARARQWRLIVVSPGETGMAAGVEFPVAGSMTIGRDPDSGIVLGDPSVSARHAVLERVQGGWRLTDTGSTNGTRVEGRPVGPGGALLRGNERIALGAVVLRLAAP